MRLKKGDDWVVQLSSDGEIHAIAHKPADLSSADARKMLTEEANLLKAYLHSHIPNFNATIVGYYFCGEKKMKYFGRL